MRRIRPSSTPYSSPARASTAALSAIRPLCDTSSPAPTTRPASTSGAGVPSRVTRYGMLRPASLTRTRSEPSGSQIGPARSSAWRRSAQPAAPTGRSRAAVSGRGAALPSTGATKSSGCASSWGSSASMPTNATSVPSAEKAGDSASPRTEASSLTSPPATGTLQSWVRGRMLRSGPRSAAKAIRVPSGDQAGALASNAPEVSWRGRAPAPARMTHRCDQRPTCPDSSLR